MEASATSTNASTTSASRKRKREDDNGRFRATLYDVQTAAPITLVPVRWLDRASVPLAWLKIQADEALPSGTLLNANPPEEVGTSPNSVLVVECLLNDLLYVLELVEEGRYICFALQPWITETRVTQIFEIKSEANDVPWLNNSSAHQRTSSTSGVAHRLPSPCSPKRPKNRRGAQARESNPSGVGVARRYLRRFQTHRTFLSCPSLLIMTKFPRLHLQSMVNRRSC